MEEGKLSDDLPVAALQGARDYHQGTIWGANTGKRQPETINKIKEEDAKCRFPVLTSSHVYSWFVLCRFDELFRNMQNKTAKQSRRPRAPKKRAPQPRESMMLLSRLRVCWLMVRRQDQHR